MNAKLFLAVAQVMLANAYGLKSDDVGLGESEAGELVRADVRPYQYINECAVRSNLERIDVRGRWGVPGDDKLLPEDEFGAMTTASGVFLVGEEIVHCPYCGSRTTFEEVQLAGQRKGLQHHRCLNVSHCAFEFITEFEEEKDERPPSAPDNIDNRIADLVIDSRPERFKGVEVQGVRYCVPSGLDEPRNIEVDNQSPEFYSVYLRDIEGLAACVGDHGTVDLARSYAGELSQRFGWPVIDGTVA